MRTLSPFRYPGGKYSLRFLIKNIIDLKGNIDEFVEPFAGGAGVSLWLLQNHYIKKIKINDYDPMIFLVWKSIFNYSKSFIEKIRETKIDFENWTIQKSIIRDKENYDRYSELELGFAAFFINRCSRSGMITDRVGPIGGKKQTGEWRIDARFNKDELIRKIEILGGLKNQIEISNCDAIEMMSRLDSPIEKTVVYVDPPYFKHGPQLYRHYFNEYDHIRLAKYLQNGFQYQWIVSYDDDIFIRKIYEQQSFEDIELFHRAQYKHIGKELLIQRL